MDSPALVPDRFSGRKLGKYELVCRLSTGGMAEIFLAFQRGVAGFRKLVVLKRILPDIGADEEIVRMFLDEARLTAAFTHPNIAHVYDLDVQEEELFLAMEFVPGATLIEVAQIARKRNEEIPIGFTLSAVRDTALALHYAHTFKDPLGRLRPVIHRDVAEKNVMVTYDGSTKLLDFGIAKAKDRITSTAVGKVKGTSGYMSPEQVVGDELDARSDIFSLGIVLHECLTGMRLFYGNDPEQGMLAALHNEVPPPSQQNPQVGPELDAVVLKALARARDGRFGNALEMARALERAAPGRFWLPETSGEFIQRLFAERREQTRALLEGMSERTNEVNVDDLLQSQKARARRTDKEMAAPLEDANSAEPSAYELLMAVAAPDGKLPPEQLPAPELALRRPDAPSRSQRVPVLGPPPSRAQRPPAAEQTIIQPPRDGDGPTGLPAEERSPRPRKVNLAELETTLPPEDAPAPPRRPPREARSGPSEPRPKDLSTVPQRPRDPGSAAPAKEHRVRSQPKKAPQSSSHGLIWAWAVAGGLAAVVAIGLLARILHWL